MLDSRTPCEVPAAQPMERRRRAHHFRRKTSRGMALALPSVRSAISRFSLAFSSSSFMAPSLQEQSARKSRTHADQFAGPGPLPCCTNIVLRSLDGAEHSYFRVFDHRAVEYPDLGAGLYW